MTLAGAVRGSIEDALTVDGVYASALWNGVHAAHECAWTGSKRLCMLYSAGLMGMNVRVVMVRDFDHLMAKRLGRGRRRHLQHRVRLHQHFEGGRPKLPTS